MGVNLRVSKKKNLKRIHRKKKNILDSIPPELVIDIVARAAAYSSKDLLNIRLRYKKLKIYDFFIYIIFNSCMHIC